MIGFGPAGQFVAEALKLQPGIETLVVDMRATNVNLARSMGFSAEVGDGTNVELLIHYGIESAKAVVVSVPDHGAAVRISRAVRTLNPLISIIVRARYHSFVNELEEIGATIVVDEEHLTGRRLAASVRSLMH